MSKNKTLFDVVIVGGGPAAMGAAIYAGRYLMHTAVISDGFGGTASMAHKICNYPGFKEISGMELMQRMFEQVADLNVPVFYEKVVDIKKEKDYFIVNSDQRTVKAKLVILALGMTRRTLGIDDESRLVGKGVSYCATCDGGFFKDKKVSIVGGSNAAVTSALYLSEIATEVNLIYRGEKLRAEPAWIELLEKAKNIKVLYGKEITKLIGENKLEEIVLNDNSKIKSDGLFIEIGSVPNTELIKKLEISTDKNGFIIVDKDQKTNIDGIFAAGDCTNASELKQIVTAASQGSIATYMAYRKIIGGK